MRLRLTLLIVLLMMITPTLAQTSTPTLTPIPGALDEGLYRFADLAAPSISLDGTWTISATDVLLQTSDNGASVTIPVRGAWAVISASPVDSEVFEVCYPLCTTYSAASAVYPGIAFAIPGQATMTIRKLAGTTLRLDRVWVMQGVVAPFDPSAFGTPAPAPSPYVVFVPVVVTAMASYTPTPSPTSTPTVTPSATPGDPPTSTPTPTSTPMVRRWVEAIAYTADGTPVPIRAEERFVITSGDQQISALLVGILILSGVSVVIQLWRR